MMQIYCPICGPVFKYYKNIRINWRTEIYDSNGNSISKTEIECLEKIPRSKQYARCVECDEPVNISS